MANYYLDSYYEAYTSFLVANKSIKKEKFPYNESIKMVKAFGLSVAFIKNPSKTVKKTAVKSNPYAIFFMDEVEDDIVIAAINTANCANIKRFLSELSDRPNLFTEEVCRVIVNYSSSKFLHYIPNPSQKIIDAHYEKHGTTVLYLDNPTEKLIKKSIRNNPHIFCQLDEKYTRDQNYIEYAIKHKSEFTDTYLTSLNADQLAHVLAYDPFSVLYMKNPTIDQVLLAMKKATRAGYYEEISDIFEIIHEFSPNDIYKVMEYVKKSKIVRHRVVLSELIRVYNKYPNDPVIEKIQKIAIGIDYRHFHDIWNEKIRTTENVKMDYLCKNRNAAAFISEIPHASEKLQLAVVEKWPELIERIDNPTVAVQYAAVSKNPKLVEKIHFDVLDPEIETYARLQM